MTNTTYAIEIKTQSGIVEHTFANKRDAQAFISALSEDELEAIVTVYKYSDDKGYQAWDEFELTKG